MRTGEGWCRFLDVDLSTRAPVDREEYRSAFSPQPAWAQVLHPGDWGYLRESMLEIDCEAESPQASPGGSPGSS